MCNQCQINSVYEFTNKRKICKTCFVRWFEKKFLYTIRRFNLIKKRDIIYYKKTKNFRDVVLENLLKMYSQKGTIKLVKFPSRKSKFASSSTADIEAKKIVETIIKKNILNLNKKESIKPLILFLDKEVLLYAKLKNLKFTEEKKKIDKISEFIDGLEKKHPEIKPAIVQTILKIT